MTVEVRSGWGWGGGRADGVGGGGVRGATDRVSGGLQGREDGGGGARCSCFHLKLDSDHNVSSSLCSPRSLVPLEGFPLSPLEEATAPGWVTTEQQLGGDSSANQTRCSERT